MPSPSLDESVSVLAALFGELLFLEGEKIEFDDKNRISARRCLLPLDHRNGHAVVEVDGYVMIVDVTILQSQVTTQTAHCPPHTTDASAHEVAESSRDFRDVVVPLLPRSVACGVQSLECIPSNDSTLALSQVVPVLQTLECIPSNDSTPVLGDASPTKMCTLSNGRTLLDIDDHTPQTCANVSSCTLSPVTCTKVSSSTHPPSLTHPSATMCVPSNDCTRRLDGSPTSPFERILCKDIVSMSVDISPVAGPIGGSNLGSLHLADTPNFGSSDQRGNPDGRIPDGAGNTNYLAQGGDPSLVAQGGGRHGWAKPA